MLINNFIKIPLYRLNEIKELYNIFYNENKNLYDLNKRKMDYF